MDTSLSMQLGPFVYQHAGQDYEFNFLWRLFSIQRRGEYSRVTMFPIWWQERPSPQTLSQFTILGGLIARDCNYDNGTYRYRILWFIPVTGSRSFTTEEDNGSESLPPKEN